MPKPTADELLVRALREVLQGEYDSDRGEIEISDVTAEQDRHFETCPEISIADVRSHIGTCGNDTCNITRVFMTIGCPHQQSADAVLARYGSWPGLLDRMHEIGRDLLEADAFDSEPDLPIP